jgi:hypothetical protein
VIDFDQSSSTPAYTKSMDQYMSFLNKLLDFAKLADAIA